MKQLRARARFKLTVDSDRFDGDVYETDADSVSMTLRVGLDNVGDKAAGHTVLNVLVPASHSFFAWSAQNGTRKPPDQDQPLPTSEVLKTPDGPELAAMWITKTVARVALRAGLVTWFIVQVPVPCELPVRVVAQSDDLPDDQEQVKCDRTFHIRRKTATG